MVERVVCPICEDWEQWEKNSHGQTVCGCQACECGESEGDPHQPGCHWED